MFWIYLTRSLDRLLSIISSSISYHWRCLREEVKEDCNIFCLLAVKRKAYHKLKLSLDDLLQDKQTI